MLCDVLEFPDDSQQEDETLAGLGFCCPDIRLCVVSWRLLALRGCDSSGSVSGRSRRRTLYEQKQLIQSANTHSERNRLVSTVDLFHRAAPAYHQLS